jgi:surface carbohydrate biosynthesis protein
MTEKIKYIIIFFLRSKKKFNIPPNRDVIVYDSILEDMFSIYINSDKIENLYVRGEILNFFVLLKLLVKGKNIFKLENYVIQYIDIVRPKVVITFIDNNVSFYKLKKHFQNIKFIFIQNGLRSTYGDVFGLLKKAINLTMKLTICL